VQDQLLCPGGKSHHTVVKKEVLEGTSRSSHNVFALLDNDVIVGLASEMGVSISLDQFDTVDVMKYLEIARHALDRVKKKEVVDPNEYDEPETIQGDEIPMLEWLDDVYDEEQFILVQSKKKKKKKK
jgi:hypothetical protein